MTVLLDAASLTLDEVERVARGGERVALHDHATPRLEAARRVIDAAVARGDAVYGANTGAGALKRYDLADDDVAWFNRAMVLGCRTGQGPATSAEQTRAVMLRLANTLAKPCVGARPLLAGLVVDALNERRHPLVRLYGSVGQADLVPLADLVSGLLDQTPVTLAAGEGLALLDNNAFSTGLAAPAVADARQGVETLETAAALMLEAYGANLSVLDGVLQERPYPGLQASATRLRTLLAGSVLWQQGAAATCRTR